MGLDAERLKARACELTGLSNFGDAPMDEGLGLFTRSISESEVSPKALQAAEAAVMTTLTERLRIEDWISRHPEVLEERIVAPVFVVGLPRSGTTALSQFLSEDPAARSIRRWEAHNTVPPPDAAVAEDPRLVATRAAFEARDQAMPQFRTMLPVDAEDATEHSVLQGLTFLSMHLPLMHHAPAYQDWLLRQDLRPGYLYMKKVLKLLQSKTPAPHWNLKCPLDLFGLDALVDVFPDARLVWSHRDPARSIPSNCSLLTMLRTAAGQEVDKIELGRMKMAVFAEGMRRALAARDMIGDDRFADVMQRDLVSDAVGVIERLYARIGLPFTDEYRARLSHRVRSRGQALEGKIHEYALEDFGLTVEEIRREFGPYVRRFHEPAGAPA